jgi:hypothetical protein
MLFPAGYSNSDESENSLNIAAGNTGRGKEPHRRPEIRYTGTACGGPAGKAGTGDEKKD